MEKEKKEKVVLTAEQKKIKEIEKVVKLSDEETKALVEILKSYDDMSFKTAVELMTKKLIKGEIIFKAIKIYE